MGKEDLNSSTKDQFQVDTTVWKAAETTISSLMERMLQGGK